MTDLDEIEMIKHITFKGHDIIIIAHNWRYFTIYKDNIRYKTRETEMLNVTFERMIAVDDFVIVQFHRHSGIAEDNTKGQTLALFKLNEDMTNLDLYQMIQIPNDTKYVTACKLNGLIYVTYHTNNYISVSTIQKTYKERHEMYLITFQNYIRTDAFTNYAVYDERRFFYSKNEIDRKSVV